MIDQGSTRLEGVEMTETWREDSILMNFAYGVEHFFTSGKIEDAYGKLGKYFARIYHTAQRLNEQTKIKTCWIEIVRNFFSALTTPSQGNTTYLLDNAYSGSDKIKNVRKEIKTFHNVNGSESAAQNLILEGYECVKNHHTLSKRRRKLLKK